MFEVVCHINLLPGITEVRVLGVLSLGQQEDRVSVLLMKKPV